MRNRLRRLILFISCLWKVKRVGTNIKRKMKKFAMGLIMALLMTISVFSQESYPRKIIIDGDTIVALTSYQLIQINNKLFDRKILLRNDSISQVSLALCSQAVNSCHEERLLCDSAQDSSEKEKIILREELDLYKQGNNELFKENIKLNNRVGFYKITTGFAVAFLLIKIFIR